MTMAENGIGVESVKTEASETNGSRVDDFAHATVPTRAQVAEEEALGQPGKALNQRNPFFIGLTGALGVAVAYLLFKAIAGVGEVLSLIGLSLFLAIGLDPAVVWLTKHRVPRWGAVILVLLGAFGIVAAFVAAAVGPISHEIAQLQVNVPRWKAEIQSGHGTVGHLATEFHANNLFKSSKIKSISPASVVGGVVGAGKLVFSAVSAAVIVIVLTVYFLVVLPSIRVLWLRLWPQSRRLRSAALTDEILSRVGGFVLGNLLTSVVAGVGTWAWLLIFGIRYPILLGLMVAIFDLIPVVGSTIGGLIVSAVALSVSVPVALATLVFYVVYRFFEDYLLTPRVMRHTVRISPGLTIIATLIGGVLLGLIGALIAIPVAAGIHLLLEEVTFPSLEKR